MLKPIVLNLPAVSVEVEYETREDDEKCGDEEECESDVSVKQEVLRHVGAEADSLVQQRQRFRRPYHVNLDHSNAVETQV